MPNSKLHRHKTRTLRAHRTLNAKQQLAQSTQRTAAVSAWFENAEQGAAQKARCAAAEGA
eukprot:1156949-Pelagomonas_calceolata.AAC.2